MPHFLGIDAGATKSGLVLGDEKRALARVRTSTIKRMKADEETAEPNLQSALQRSPSVGIETARTLSWHHRTFRCYSSASRNPTEKHDFVQSIPNNLLIRSSNRLVHKNPDRRGSLVAEPHSTGDISMNGFLGLIKPVRRLWMEAILVLLLCVSPLTAQNFSEIKPSPQQVNWQNMEFGVIIHFSTNTFLDREWGDGKADPAVFNPTQFDPDQWMKAIRDSGAKYVVLVAKHHDGFCLWPTAQTDYSVKASPWKNGKGDVVGDVARSARKYGLKFGIYLSPWDRHDPRYNDPAAYDRYYLAELAELSQNYGDLVELWLDGAGSAGHVYDFKSIIETLRTYQPNTIVFADTGLFEYGDARWVGTESGRVPYENWNVIDRHGFLRWRPIESDTPLRNLEWFWHPNHETSLKSLTELLTTYDETVGHGAQLMLGLAPDRRGLLPDNDVARLEEFGKAVRARYAHNLALQHSAASAGATAALDGDPDTFWSAPVGSHHASIEVSFPKPITFNRALTTEWINDGQHIQQYSIDVWTGNAWKSVAAAQAIGHKKIDIFPPVTASRVRLNILSSTDAAAIREFQIYNVEETREPK